MLGSTRVGVACQVVLVLSRGYRVVLDGGFTSALHPRSQKCMHFGGPLLPCYAIGLHVFSAILGAQLSMWHAGSVGAYQRTRT